MFKQFLSFIILLHVSISAFSQVIKVDSSFNLVGYHTLNLSPGNYTSQAGYAIKINPADNRYIVRAEANPLFGYIKYKRDGSLDSSFNTIGYCLPSNSEGAEWFNFEFDDQQRIVNGKHLTDASFWTAFMRTKQNGTPDSSFGINGVLTVSNTTASGSRFYRMNDGSYTSINLGGFSNGYGIMIRKFKSDYSVDASFGNGGFIDHRFGYQDLSLTKAVFYPDGKFVVGAVTRVLPVSADGYDYNATFFRFLPNGNLDSSFGTNGIAQPVYTVKEEGILDILVTADNKIIGAGFNHPGSDRSGFIMRLLPDGSIDSTFGIAGTFKTTQVYEILSAALQRDNKILYAGYFGYTIGRVTETGISDAEFGNNGTFISPFSFPYGFPFNMLLENDTTLMLTGNAFCDNQCDNVTTARYKLSFQPYLVGVASSYCPGGAGSGTIINMPLPGSDTVVSVLIDNAVTTVTISQQGSFSFPVGAAGQHTLQIRFTKGSQIWKELRTYTVSSAAAPVITTTNQFLCADGTTFSPVANTAVYWSGNGVSGTFPSTSCVFDPTGLTGTQQIICMKDYGVCGLKYDTLIVELIHLTPTISINGNFLSTPLTTGAAYKWYRNGLSTTLGIQSNQYLPTQNGNYKVLELLANCGVFSAEVAYPATSLCSNGSNAITSNVTGSSYQWQVNTGNGFSDMADNGYYSGTNSATLQLSNIPSSQYGYQYRCFINGASYSSIFFIKFTNTWTGAINSNWENPLNWSCGFIPDSNTDVIINNGPVLLSSNTTIRTLTIAPGINLTVGQGYTLTVTH